MKGRRIIWSVLLVVIVTLAYLANGRTIGAGDTLPARYLPWSVLRHLDFDLSRFPSLYGEEARQMFPLLDGTPYFLRFQHGHYLSAYTPGPALAALPIYALPVLAGLPSGTAWDARLEKLAAAIITALSVLVLFWALRELVSLGWSLSIAAIYAFGTSSLSVSSQALWQHGPSQLFLALVVYCVAKGLTAERYFAYAGFAMSAGVVMRVTDVVLVAPVAAWILLARRHLALKFCLFALPPAIVLGFYHLVYVGSIGDGSRGTAAPTWAFFTQVRLSEGLLGLLVSPGRGLFVYSPVLVFSVFGILAVWRRGHWPLKALSIGPPLLVMMVSKWFLWWGGHSWGPRLLADAAPILCFFLYPISGWLDRRRLGKAFFVLLALLSVGAHALGAALYDGRWDGMADIDHDDARLWSWRGSPLTFYGGEAVSSIRHVLWPPAGRSFTSATSPEMLAASYTVEPIPAVIYSGESIVVSLIARNTGQAVWLAAAPGAHGAVRLGWRWYRANQEISGGRAPLAADVLPGEAGIFRASIASPARPGEYTLFIDLVSERVTWFGDRGQVAVSTAVRVAPFDAARVLSSPLFGSSASPTVTIATDRDAYRHNDILHLEVELNNAYRPRQFDAYLVLSAPDGEALLYDGHRNPARTKGAWAAWVKGLPLPARVTGRFSIPLSEASPGGLAPGLYAWHVVLTEAGTYRILARAATPFTLSR